MPSHSSSVVVRINPADADPETSPSPFGPPNVYIGQPERQMVPASLILIPPAKPSGPSAIAVPLDCPHYCAGEN